MQLNHHSRLTSTSSAFARVGPVICIKSLDEGRLFINTAAAGAAPIGCEQWIPKKPESIYSRALNVFRNK